MCLICVQPKGADFPMKSRIKARLANSDGFGLMYAQHNRVNIVKSIGGVAEIEELWEQYGNGPLVAHWRLGTHGMPTVHNCHPFPVLWEGEGDDARVTLAMAHNGVFASAPSALKGGTDSEWFVRERIRPLLLQQPDLIYSTAFQTFLGEMIGYNKLAFLDHKGEVVLVNGDLGTEWEGCWVSQAWDLRDRVPVNTVHSGGYGRPFEGAAGDRAANSSPIASSSRSIPTFPSSAIASASATPSGSGDRRPGSYQSPANAGGAAALPAALQHHMDMDHQLSLGMLEGMSELQLKRLCWLYPTRVAMLLARCRDQQVSGGALQKLARLLPTSVSGSGAA